MITDCDWRTPSARDDGASVWIEQLPESVPRRRIYYANGEGSHCPFVGWVFRSDGAWIPLASRISRTMYRPLPPAPRCRSCGKPLDSHAEADTVCHELCRLLACAKQYLEFPTRSTLANLKAAIESAEQLTAGEVHNHKQG